MAQAKIVIIADIVDGVPMNVSVEGTDVSLATMSVMLAYFVDSYVKELAKQGLKCAGMQAKLVYGFIKSLEQGHEVQTER